MGIHKFQSTHPLRGATTNPANMPIMSKDFNPRTPCGVRLVSPEYLKIMIDISIHAPLAGCDQIPQRIKDHIQRFQSTHPLRGATSFADYEPKDCRISIHAPLAGCDLFRTNIMKSTKNFNPRTPCGVRLGTLITIRVVLDFNPRTPCGVRQQAVLGSMLIDEFQSTHPLRGATI